jgi:hypothetical protein
MRVLFFDLALSTQAQVREAINIQAKAGHTGGIYFWINKVNGELLCGVHHEFLQPNNELLLPYEGTWYNSESLAKIWV